ncbi:MAG: hypothetical protein AB7J47_23855 [Acidimicrobiia bacterium]
MNRPPYRRSDDLAAYTYRADLYCPACVINAMITHRDASPPARDMTAEAVLDQCADAMAIDRSDETSFDSSEFPQPVFLDTVAPDDRCAACHGSL